MIHLLYGFLNWLTQSIKIPLYTTHLSPITFSIGSTCSNTNMDNFKQPKLTSDELFIGTRLGFDSWADTSCAGKHAHVESFIERKSVNAIGFSSSLGTISNLPIANVVYAYDFDNGETILLENFNAIYLGTNMDDSLVNPIQCEDNDVRIDLHPKHFYPNMNEECQMIKFNDGTIIPLEFDGVLPHIRIQRPTLQELDTCRQLQLTSDNDWNPKDMEGVISTVNIDTSFDERNNIDYAFDPPYAQILASQVILHNNNDDYFSISALRSNSSNTLTVEQLSSMWNIGLKTAERTILATTHKIIRTTGLLS